MALCFKWLQIRLLSNQIRLLFNAKWLEGVKLCRLLQSMAKCFFWTAVGKEKSLIQSAPIKQFQIINVNLTGVSVFFVS